MKERRWRVDTTQRKRNFRGADVNVIFPRLTANHKNPAAVFVSVKKRKKEEGKKRGDNFQRQAAFTSAFVRRCVRSELWCYYQIPTIVNWPEMELPRVAN